ncbi:MAG: hypothetical protein IPN69_17115 [Acidobacteria bacterium]|nr:hypothetical protein [Acidobacteriota bacterium]MBK8812433.1 hypothetical protein [Acidobacteriota bacterium]
MATYAELKLAHRIFMRRYPFGQYAVTDAPEALLRKPLNESRVALITSAGLRLPSHQPFDRSIRSGDTSFREIANDAALDDLIEDHKSSAFDHAGIAQDKNLAFPLERFRELGSIRTIGELNKRHFSFMGSIIGPQKLIDETAPEVAELLVRDEVDCVFLTPV